jgi:hypothetical protein
MDSISTAQPARHAFTRSIASLSGMAAALLLLAFYVVLVGLANSPRHAMDLLWADRYLVGAVAAGFGLQVGLYVHVRLLRARARALRSSNAMAAAGTGTSTVAMVACCAHHVTDVLPLVGLSGAAIFLNDYRLPIIVAGLVVNAAGIVVMLRTVRTTQTLLTPHFHALAGGQP